MPPFVKQTQKDSRSQSGKGSRRRLSFLKATAAVASGLGIALGSTLRFQVLSTDQTTLFKPQQDFPPLAEWPPEIPPEPHHGHFDSWENETFQPDLIDREPTRDIENYQLDSTADREGDYAEDYSVEDAIAPDVPGPTPATFDNEFTPPGATGSEDPDTTDTLPPEAPTEAREFEPAPDAAPGIEDDSATDAQTWFDKQAASDYPFSNGPVIISPDTEASDAPPDLPTDTSLE
ncbi:MAG: hypothetical protein AAGI45_00230 [Cyanobacteria bacterium P01_H01_bin.26]